MFCTGGGGGGGGQWSHPQIPLSQLERVWGNLSGFLVLLIQHSHDVFLQKAVGCSYIHFETKTTINIST